MDYVTASGLVVSERRARAAFPRDNAPNDNEVLDPHVGVGPNSSDGVGNALVMYDGAGLAPPGVQAWSGWPVEWATPNWGASVGIDVAMQRSSTVFAAIDLNASVLSTMPPYRTVGGRLAEPVEWMTNPQPEVYTGWVEAIKQVMVSFHGGEVFLWATARNDDGTVRRWVMLNPSWVNVHITGQIRTYEMLGADITADVLHIRYLSWPGDARGHGPLESAATNLFGAEAMERYAANLATRGGVPWGVLTAPGKLSAHQAADMRTQFVLSRMSSMGAPAVLSGGMTLQPMTINPKDMALLELRGFEESRLATLLGCPPTLLGLPTGDGSLTYRNVEGIYDFHWRAYLRPKAAAVMEAISQWALTPREAVELNRDEYVRPALAERAGAYAVLHGIVDEEGRRAITVPEIRAGERFDVSSGVRSESTSLAVP